MSERYLSGLFVKNFRGIGDDGIRLCPFQKVNFFIGPNNAGKSTVLNFLASYLHRKDTKPVREQWVRHYDPIDIRLGRSADSIRFAIGIPQDEFDKQLDPSVIASFSGDLEKIAAGIAIEGFVWLTPADDLRSLEFEKPDNTDVKALLPSSRWRDLWGFLTGGSGGSLEQHWIPESLKRIAGNILPSLPEVRFIPAIREITEKGAEFTDYSGRGLIDQLAELQNPPHNERNKKEKFEKINTFLQSVTDSPDAQIEVPHDRRHLLVDMDGKILPLSSLGTGIHEVIMLASFCTLVENEIVCVEEPEIHLHPLLQRKLIRYLEIETSNQYFIATHSASLLDAVDASIFSVDNLNGETKVTLAVQSGKRYEICRRLGYHASDILQANFVVWVEGPSDRIYLNHWIRSIAPDLIEGTDYSIMFYGGRLLSHLSANDDEVSEFISLRRLNRNIAVLIDIDRPSPHARINATKARLLSELGQDACWVTAGREIENYVPVNLMESALTAIYPARYLEIEDKGRHGHRLVFREKGSSKGGFQGADKIKVAQKIANEPAQLTELDLRKRVEALVQSIREAGPQR